MSEVTLPSWAKFIEGSPKACCIVEVDSEKAYEEWLAKFIFPVGPAAEIDQYWLEVAYQCIKMDVQAALEGTEMDPQKAGRYAQINFTRAPRFALANHPAGKGADAASRGLEARAHYVRIRGRVPFST